MSLDSLECDRVRLAACFHLSIGAIDGCEQGSRLIFLGAYLRSKNEVLPSYGEVTCRPTRARIKVMRIVGGRLDADRLLELTGCVVIILLQRQGEIVIFKNGGSSAPYGSYTLRVERLP